MRLPPALPRLVVWFDPGQTTGVAILTTDLLMSGVHVFRSRQWNTTEIVDELQDLFDTFAIMRGQTAWVGWENYLVLAGGGAVGTPKHALEAIGVIRGVCDQYKVRRLASVPSSARNVISTDILKTIGWHKPGLDHANDASQHLAAWCLREGYLREFLEPALRKVLPA